MKMKKTLLSALLLFSAIATQAQLTQRLVGTHRSIHNGNGWQVSDSVQLKYKWGNANTGGAMEYEAGTLKYDTSRRYAYNGSGYIEQYLEISHYNSAGLKDTVLGKYNMGSGLVNNNLQVYRYDGSGRDTAYYWYSWNGTTGSWVLFSHNVMTYGPSGILTRIIQTPDVNGVPTNSTRELYTYTGGNLTSIENETWLSSAWRGQWRDIYSYDANNNNDTIWNQSWDISTSSYYTTNFYRFVYNALNKPTLTELYNDNGSNWKLTTQDKYVYDGANRLVSDSVLYADFSGNIFPTVANRYQYNVAGGIDTQCNIRWAPGGVVLPDSTRTYTTYNVLGQITRRTSNMWDAATASWIDKVGAIDQKFWYEVTAGIDNRPGSSIAGISLYPNPASSFVNIDVKMDRQQPYTVSIYNTTGSLLRQWEEKGSNSRMISTADLQAGNYIVTIRSGSDVQSAQFVIAR